MTLHPLTPKGGAFVSQLGLVFRKRQVSIETCRFQLYSPCGELYWLRQLYLLRKLYWALPSFKGEYNITETTGFNITFCVAKYITSENG